MKKLLALSIAAVFAAGMGGTALAQTGAAGEASVAHAHALMAQSATSLATAQAHLHHVINCLVGPKGHGFDAKAEDPCKGQGNGAIPDAGGDAALHTKLTSALADAQGGLKATSLAAAQASAAKAAAALGDTPAQKPQGGYSW